MAPKLMSRVFVPPKEIPFPAALPENHIKVDPETDPLFVQYPKDDEQRREIWLEANDEFKGVIVRIA